MIEIVEHIHSFFQGAVLDWAFAVVAAFALLNYYKINRTVPYLLDFLLIESVIRLGTTIVILEGPQNNLLLYSFISFFRFVYGYLMFKELFESEKWRYALAILGIAYIFYTSFFTDTQELNAICMAFVQFWWIVVALAYLNNTYSNLQIENLWKEPKMWVVAGMLFYGVSIFFVYLFSSRIHTIEFRKEALDALWVFEHIGTIIFCICTLKAILLSRRVN